MADDVDVLMPDMDVQIGDERVTVREYRFREGLQVAARAQDFLRDLGRMFLQEDGSPVDSVDLDDLQTLFGLHEDEVTWMIAKSIDKPPSWLDKLNDEDGLALMHVWWSVNQPFFTRRLVTAAATRRMTATATAVPADSGSSLPH